MGVIIRSLQSRRSKYNVTLVLTGGDICDGSCVSAPDGCDYVTRSVPVLCDSDI